jgi:putative peptidoglycan lipid II flippase
MAEDVSALDFAGLRTRASLSIRSLWLLVAPCVALLIALAEPAVRLVFEHGAFTRADSAAVALLLRIYAPSLVAVALSAISGRAIYALKAVRFFAAMGALEGLLYIAYTAGLAQRLGAAGIALGFTIYFLGSISWQLVYLRHALAARGRRVLRAFVVITLLAAGAGVVAWVITRGIDAPLLALVIGGVGGLASYAGGVLAARRVGALAA